MSTCALFGFTGFVGHWLLRNKTFTSLYNSKNIESARGQQFDTVYFCALPAAKWLANKDPENDWRNIVAIQDVLKSVNITKKLVLISTVDVYDTSVTGQNETTKPTATHAYGRHRFAFEEFVREHFDNVIVVRLPALFGRGLKKNVIYDLLNNNCVENISRATHFQWYNMQWLVRDLDAICSKNSSGTFNLCTEPLATESILQLFPDSVNNCVVKTSPTVSYDIETIFAEHLVRAAKKDQPRYVRTKETVLADISAYTQAQTKQLTQTGRAKKGISAIALAKLAPEHVPIETAWIQFCALSNWFDMDYCEVAPTVLFQTWEGFFAANAAVKLVADTQRLLGAKKLVPPQYSLQSITYGLRDLNIFCEKTSDKLLAHIVNVAKAALPTQSRIMVFGSPVNRRVPDGMSLCAAQQIAAVFFRKLGDALDQEKLDQFTLCVENNSSAYKCNFLTTSSETAEFVKLVDHARIGMTLDVGNAMLENESDEIMNTIDKHIGLIKHVHVSQPYMRPLHKNDTYFHESVARKLQEVGYSRGITLEMLCENGWQEFSDSVSLFKEWYGDV